MSPPPPSRGRREQRARAAAEGPGHAARRAALAAVEAVEVRGAYSNFAVPAAVSDLADARDRSLASHLAYETVRWRGTLDWALDHVVDRPHVEDRLRRVLRLGAVQLLRTNVPARAAVSTTVTLAGEVVPPPRAAGARAFANGVLRTLARRIDALPWPDPVADPVGNLVLATAHPRWMVEELVERFGPEEARQALEADNDPPGLTLRSVGDRERLVDELRAAGFEATPGQLAPEAVRVPGADPFRLAAVAEGRALPQDEASMLVAHATRAPAGGRVLDLCAGPGGKATHLATLAGGGGTVVALEVRHRRARLVRERALKLGVRVLVVTGDGTAPPLRGGFDTVLVDAPCTGLGTGRRRPEVRWRRDPGDVGVLARLQRRLLLAAAPLVAEGGCLTYAACTWTAAETEAVIDPPPDGFDVVETVQRWPHRDGTDGMFHATMRRGMLAPGVATSENG